MSVEILKKERNVHDRIRKKVVLVITADISVTSDTYADRFGVDRSTVSIRVLCTDLKGKSLKKAVARYIKEKSMKVADGDRLIYLDEKFGGGDDIDCPNITFRDNKTGKDVSYTLFGPWESDPARNILNFKAPLGQAIYNMEVGETKKFNINGIDYDYTVKSIELAEF